MGPLSSSRLPSLLFRSGEGGREEGLRWGRRARDVDKPAWKRRRKGLKLLGRKEKKKRREGRNVTGIPPPPFLDAAVAPPSLPFPSFPPSRYMRSWRNCRRRLGAEERRRRGDLKTALPSSSSPSISLEGKGEEREGRDFDINAEYPPPSPFPLFEAEMRMASGHSLVLFY